MKAKTKVVIMEGTSEISSKELARLITRVMKFYMADSDFSLTQKVRVQVAQPPAKGQQ